jgi:hypothetical protein
MKDEIIIPNFDWYSKIGKELGLPPRCPFASVDRCPRYFYSRSLMGDAGATKIEPAEDKRLLRKWQYSSLAPATRRQRRQPPGLHRSRVGRLRWRSRRRWAGDANQ